MHRMPGGNLLIWSRLDPSVEEKRSEDGRAASGVCVWMQRTLDRMEMMKVMCKM